MPRLLAAAMMFSVAAGAAAAQSSSEVFDPENAVLDTSIAFAAGARESEQSLRGAFGWPTFQEGSINGVNYRFDPDGYARFAASPRLDSDVFEVICRPRTVRCAARKLNLVIALTERGNVHLTIEDLAPRSEFFLSDGTSLLPLPERIQQPLDAPLEALLGAGRELIVRSPGGEQRAISLAGFAQVVTYLRWAAAGQDMAVLPADWPRPATPKAERAAEQGTATVPLSDDESPSAQWANVAAARALELQQRVEDAGDPTADAAAAVPVPAAAGTDAGGNDLADRMLAGEIARLAEEIGALAQSVSALEVAIVQRSGQPVETRGEEVAEPVGEAALAPAGETGSVTAAGDESETPAPGEAEDLPSLAALLKELGLSSQDTDGPGTATVAGATTSAAAGRTGATQQPDANADSAKVAGAEEAVPTATDAILVERALIREILAELARAETAPEGSSTLGVAVTNAPAPSRVEAAPETDDGYRKLTAYLRDLAARTEIPD